jgi:hypothetical protein
VVCGARCGTGRVSQVLEGLVLFLKVLAGLQLLAVFLGRICLARELIFFGNLIASQEAKLTAAQDEIDSLRMTVESLRVKNQRYVLAGLQLLAVFLGRICLARELIFFGTELIIVIL